MDRRGLWESINEQSSNLANSPWIVLGDFNTIYSPLENFGASQRWIAAIMEFWDCLNQSQLEELRSTGIQFSWNNMSVGHANIAKRPDKAVINEQWTLTYHISNCTFLTPGLLDHNSLLIKMGAPTSPKKLPFKYFNAWATNPLFLPTVEQVWATPISRTSMFQLTQKLKLLKRALKLNCMMEISQVSTLVTQAKQSLASCQTLLYSNPRDIQLRLQEKELM
ncbi:uncharacterized protein LOC132316696 [Cornus florida]|uniref:uncharacterized protein LOC132316696 n=1 Tax=Cornus florida TaxID=4283 RepID=UPI0028998FF6|nr:uncharacterized protein LOC132316696 [Cornus florida]